MKDRQDDCESSVIRDHRRQWRQCLYVYPVISRRARGLSIGVNLNPDKRCNFACLYCQIDRRIRRNLHSVDMGVLAGELREAMAAAVSGDLWREERFAATPAGMRRINDIAFSGDGEPTCLSNFDEAVAMAAAVRKEFHAEDVKIVVITNATQLDQPQFRRALKILDAGNGEIWAKLDAGTEDYFKRVNRPGAISLDKIVRNLAAIAGERPIVIQTLLFRIDGQAPPEAEIEAYCNRVQKILDAPGRVKLIQLHTIARSPQDAAAAPLSDAELDALAEKVRTSLSGVAVEVYYGQDVPPQPDRV